MVTTATNLPKVKGYVANPYVDLPLNEFGKLDVGGAVGQQGYINVIKDIGLKEPYVGICPLVSGEIAEDFAEYFAKSEQKNTAVALGVLVDKNGVKSAGGYIITPMPDATDEEIIAAAKNANAHEFIMSLPEGYDTDIGQRGIKLSGGQKQRVSIAGVLAMHPKCIVLDEPTAMLDPSGRKEVIRAVRGLNQVEGVTLILITHYMEEIIHADKVFVMDEGKIAMQGTPREIFSQVEQLKKLRLDVPQVTLLSYELQKRGIPLPDGILTREELVNALGYGKTDRK